MGDLEGTAVTFDRCGRVFRRCAGCGKVRVSAVGGLCVRCRGERVDAESGWRRGAPPPPEPTDALPGTEAKIAVMEARVAAGFLPCHPLDANGNLS